MKINDIIINESIGLGDNFDIELGNMIIESRVVGFMNDGVIIEADNKALALLGLGGALLESVEQGVAEDSLEEVDRRGFLRGLGGAALGAAGLGAASQTQGKVRFDADGNRTSGFLGGGSTASTAPATSSAPATGSLKDQSAASRATAEKAAAAAAKIRYSNPKFNQEYERIEKTYEKIKSIVYNNKTPLSKDPDLARRQHAESIKILISADIEFAEKTNALLKQYGALKEQDVAEGFNSDLEMELHQLTKSPDMYDAIYNALGKNDAVGSHLQDMLYDIARENRLHPDDDQEQIIDIIADRLESDYGDPDISEAKYQGREVPLGKPMRGDVKKSKVYVRGPKGNVVKVNFGDKKMKIKKSNPKRRKSFRARHNCANPGPRWKARYWSCRAW